MFWCKLFWFFFTLIVCEGVFEDCDYYQELIPNQEYFVYSPEYPARYPPGKSCRWVSMSPPDTKIELTCSEFNIPYSQNCYLDRLGISEEGRLDLADVKYYCGSGTLYAISKSNRMNIVFFSETFSPSGTFFCEMKVKEFDSPTPPNPTCSCGYTNSMRIVGGNETGVNEYPMMAGLIDVRQRMLFCGSTIISQKYAVTAAHCLAIKKAESIALLVGEHDLATGSDTDSSQLYKIESFQMHPLYNSTTYRNDIGLVRVLGEMKFDAKVGPACLPFLNSKNSFAGQKVTALGWGTIEFGGPTSDKLLGAPLDVITFERCQGTYGDLIFEKQLCTYTEDKDACQSDSGGPLLWRDPYAKVVKIVGIISYGMQCATIHPSVNTRVTSHLEWIQYVTGEEFCVL